MSKFNYSNFSKTTFLLILVLLLIIINGTYLTSYSAGGNIRIQLLNYELYQVKPGDSLWKISRKFEISVSKIKEVNQLQSNMIFVGQKLKIPGSETNNSTYVVKPGDSLWKLSQRFNITIQQLKQINNLDSNIIQVGQKLMVSGTQTETKSRAKVKGKINISNKTRGNNLIRKESVKNHTVLPLNKTPISSEHKESEIIVKYKALINPSAVDEMESENGLKPLSQIKSDVGKVVRYRVAKDKKLNKLVEKYNKLETVAWAEPNYIFYPTAIPDDPYYNYYQWDYVNLNLEAAWDVTRGDNSVVVAVLDTGIITDHPDLKPNLLQGADFVGGEKSYPVSSYSMTDLDPTDETTRAKGGSHGTHVAGIIGAVTDNNQGVAGINWNVNLLPIRVLKKTGGTSWDIAEGIYYAIDQGADIINLSLGSNHDSHLQREAVKAAAAEDITIVSATGNEGSASVYYPAAYPETIAVGAVSKNNSVTRYSNYGSEVDLVAPGGAYGESIYSTWGYMKDGATNTSYVGMIGTSMATPHVSGIAALLVANGISDPDTIRMRLVDTAFDLGSPGRDNHYGYGLVDAYGALLGKKLKQPKVFAATKGGDKVYLKSEIKSVTDDGRFTLEKVVSEKVLIIGWRDVNQNGIIDQGDYYGQTRQKLDIKENRTYNADLVINYISDSGFSYDVVK